MTYLCSVTAEMVFIPEKKTNDWVARIACGIIVSRTTKNHALYLHLFVRDSGF